MQAVFKGGRRMPQFAIRSRMLRDSFPNASCPFNLQAFCAILAVLRQQMIDSEADMEKTEIKNGSEIYGTVRELLRLFGADSVQTVEFTDSSHGDSDIRHNYLIDRKYVLRINSAPVMTDRRLEELNRLIERYREFGMHAPKFLKAKDGRFIVERDGNICYLSEYLDETVADDVKDGCLEELRTQRRIFIARFAEKYRNVDLTEMVSMYSIFDLSPYDKLDGLEIDEKQDNFNHLTADLQKAGEYALAERLVQENESIRRELKSFYKELPRCVFQGDENFSNLCVDENRRISGLFDFNMSGTEVIANYLANAALNFFYTDEIMQSRSADEIYRMLTKAYAESTELIRKYYNFTPQEFRAYRLYSKIAMYSAYWNTSAFSEFLAQEQCAEKVVRLLWKIAEEDFRA